MSHPSGSGQTTTVADLLCGTRVELCGRTATILGFAGAEHFHELRVRVDGTGEEETWWIGNLTKPSPIAETRSENNIEIGGTLGKRVTLPDTGVLEICWRQPHGAVSFWQLRNHPHLGSRGLNKHGHDFIDDLEAALAKAKPIRKLRPDDPKDCSECRAMADGLCCWHATERKKTSSEFAAICQRIFAREATIPDMLAFITTELEDALNNSTPADRDQSTTPEGLWVIDEWHGSACVSRAYSMLFQLTDALKANVEPPKETA